MDKEEERKKGEARKKEKGKKKGRRRRKAWTWLSHLSNEAQHLQHLLLFLDLHLFKTREHEATILLLHRVMKRRDKDLNRSRTTDDLIHRHCCWDERERSGGAEREEGRLGRLG